MKTRVIVLLSAIAVFAIMIATLGSYIKFCILQPFELDDDYNIMELPFQVLTDEGLKFSIELAIEMRQEQEDSTSDTWTDTDPTSNPSSTQTQLPTHSTPGTDHTQPGATGPVTQPSQPDSIPTDPDTKPTQPTTEPTKPISYNYPHHDFSEGSVSSDWFENTLFIGESRTVGLRDYARSGNAEYFCGVGATVFNITKKEFGDGSHFSKQTLESLLSGKKYDKVFINLGINECGYSTKSIIAAYKKVLALVQQYQPDATVILQGVIMVTKGYAGSKESFQPSNISKLNAKIEALADNSKIFFIDANLYFTDPDGFLYSDVTGDGCHFTGKYYKVWSQWISFAVGQLDIA